MANGKLFFYRLQHHNLPSHELLSAAVEEREIRRFPALRDCGHHRAVAERGEFFPKACEPDHISSMQAPKGPAADNRNARESRSGVLQEIDFELFHLLAEFLGRSFRWRAREGRAKRGFRHNEVGELLQFEGRSGILLPDREI